MTQANLAVNKLMEDIEISLKSPQRVSYKNKKHSSNIKLSSLIGKNKKVIDAIESNDTKIIIDYLYRSTISGNESRFLAVNNSLISWATLYILFLMI